MPKLRQWQQDAVTKAVKWFISGTDRHFIINAAPGAGKTTAAAAIARDLIALGEIERVVVIAPRKAVVEQWARQCEVLIGRPMAQITGKDSAMGSLSLDLAATWNAVDSLRDVFQTVCKSARTLVICDEHHHAAIEAAWGRSAESAFADARYALILTGTPVRSDGANSVWLKQDSFGGIEHPEAGSYTLTYGEAVDLGYCRPVTFHRHHGAFTVKVSEETFSVSSRQAADVPADHPGLQHLQRSLDFYRIVKVPRVERDGKTPAQASYHRSMLEAASAELDLLRDEMPKAGGLVIAPSILVADTFASIIEQLEGAPPIKVHSQARLSDRKIDLFRKSPGIRWIVSVGMVAEGVDIPRLRVLVYLPSAMTELVFRQAVGRVVRSAGPGDSSRAYVVMPAVQLFDEYARRIEDDMPPSTTVLSERVRYKRCPICRGENALDGSECEHCNHPLPTRKTNFRACEGCGHLNPAQLQACQSCGASMIPSYEITVREALRDGVISRGVDLGEDDIAAANTEAATMKRRLVNNPDDELAQFIGKIPKEILPRLRVLLNSSPA